VDYTQPVPASAQTDFIAAVENNLSGVGCISNNACTITTTVSSVNQNRKRRTSSTTLAMQFSIQLTDTDSLDLAGYLTSGTGINQKLYTLLYMFRLNLVYIKR
jgi:hypothetical protein